MKDFNGHQENTNTSNVIDSILIDLQSKLKECTSDLSPFVCYEDSFYMKREFQQEAYKEAINIVKKYYFK